MCSAAAHSIYTCKWLTLHHSASCWGTQKYCLFLVLILIDIVHLQFWPKYSVPKWQNIDFSVMFDIFCLYAVLKTKLVRARMDQAARKVYVSSTMHRTFGRAQWQQLRDLLHSWKTNLQITQEGMKTVAAAQMDLLAQQWIKMWNMVKQTVQQKAWT